MKKSAIAECAWNHHH